MQHPIPAPESWRHSSHALLVHAARGEIRWWIDLRAHDHGEAVEAQSFLVVDLRGAVGREVGLSLLSELAAQRRIERARRSHAAPALVIPISEATLATALKDLAELFVFEPASRASSEVALFVVDKDDAPRVVIATPGLPPLGPV